MGFTAVHLVNGNHNHSGFESRKEAIHYITGFICQVCANDITMGYVHIHDNLGNVVEKQIIEDVFDTSCGSEWMVITDEDYEDADTIEDLFIANGFEPSPEAEEQLTFEQKMKLQKKREEKENQE